MAEKRLIDANFLDDRCRRQMADEWNKKVAPVSWSEAYKEFLDDVWDAPTVDAVEVAHGRWIWHEEEFKYECSACNCKFDYNHTFGIFDHGYEYGNYCPHCGTKMDGDVIET